MKEKKIKELKESFDEGVITKEEFDNQEKIIPENTKSNEDSYENKTSDVSEEDLIIAESKKSDKIFIIGAIILFVVFIAIFSWSFFKKPPVESIEELHLLNINGKLDSDKGYVYKGGYSFVNIDNFWYTQLKSQSGKTLYNFNFRYSPRELEDIKIKGRLDIDKFNNATRFYSTFNPIGDDFGNVRLASLDYDLHMINVFKKMPISACDRNITNVSGCLEVPIITCDNTDEIVIYYNESDKFSVEYKGNCILIKGKGLDLVKGVDRVLYNLYGIMD